MKLADRIRQCALARFVEPARDAGLSTVKIRAGDVGKSMALFKRTPAICSALASSSFQNEAGIRLLDRKGPLQSTTTEFHYALDDSSRKSTAAPPPRAVEPIVRNVEAGRTSTAAVDLYLVSCVGRKLDVPVKAKDLYASDWFRKAKAFVEQTGRPWFILSAEHGLLDPETIIPPYEKTLNTMPVTERRAWAQRVFNKIEPYLGETSTVSILAGRRYREFLEPLLRGRDLSVVVPMEGLKIGEQLSWLGRRLHG